MTQGRTQRTTEVTLHMHLDNIKDGTHQSLLDLFSIAVLGGRGVSSLGFRVQLPYLRSHSANGGQVIACTQEVWSVDLQLKVAQPLDNSLWALQERRQGACGHWHLVCFFTATFHQHDQTGSYSGLSLVFTDWLLQLLLFPIIDCL